MDLRDRTVLSKLTESDEKKKKQNDHFLSRTIAVTQTHSQKQYISTGLNDPSSSYKHVYNGTTISRRGAIELDIRTRRVY